MTPISSKNKGNPQSMNRIMIYGATGYTGRLAATTAKSAGLDLVLAGREKEALRALARELSVDYRVFALDDQVSVRDSLEGIAVLLNCAGPFVHTAEKLMDACLQSGAHYLDIAAELDSYQLADQKNEAAIEAGVMLMPGGGGSVAMLGSLASRALERATKPAAVRIALHVSGSMSRGSAISASQNITAQCLMLKDNVLVSRDPGEVRNFDFGDYEASCFPVTLPDLVTIARQTGIGNIETYVHVSGNAFPEGDPAALPAGPTAEERQANRYQASVEIVGVDGAVKRAVLDTVNGYTFTPLAAVEASRRILAGEFAAGFQTPVGLFGNSFAESIADTTITHLTSPGHPARPAPSAAQAAVMCPGASPGPL
ncbi:MAG: saccharopine dehydrogenase NADP-binding domain-containing protein [Stenotrophomonas maltophilia]